MFLFSFFASMYIPVLVFHVVFMFVAFVDNSAGCAFFSFFFAFTQI